MCTVFVCIQAMHIVYMGLFWAPHMHRHTGLAVQARLRRSRVLASWHRVVKRKTEQAVPWQNRDGINSTSKSVRAREKLHIFLLRNSWCRPSSAMSIPAESRFTFAISAILGSEFTCLNKCKWQSIVVSATVIWYWLLPSMWHMQTLWRTGVTWFAQQCGKCLAAVACVSCRQQTGR